MKQTLNKVKSHLVGLDQRETDPIKKENINHLTYMIDELILGKNRISNAEILDTFNAYSERMLDVKICYLIMQKLLGGR